MTTKTAIQKTRAKMEKFIEENNIDWLDNTVIGNLAFGVRFHLAYAEKYYGNDMDSCELHVRMAADQAAQLLKEVA